MQTQYRGYSIHSSSLIQVGSGLYRGAAKITPDDPSLPALESFIRSPNELGYETEAEARETATQAAKTAINNLLVLKAFQVGDCDIVAAFTPEGAFAVLEERCGKNEFIELDDVVLIDEKGLDAPVVDDEGQSRPTIRQLLAELTKPAYLFGWE